MKVEEPINTKIPIIKVYMEWSDTKNIILEKRTLEDKLKDYKEKSSTKQKVNVASGSRKGKINVIMEEDINPVLTEEEKNYQAARDKDLDHSKSLKVTLDL
ncbi:unnamed protein product [Lactuca virosa]|uniref:Uncharacterized protein n=1 Tax=Lactuca virosa TaxID=75947 RepID=A0AAU9P3H0_9ASTR|nr:unnamed protein product [Lactuca virosa]